MGLRNAAHRRHAADPHIAGLRPRGKPVPSSTPTSRSTQRQRFANPDRGWLWTASWSLHRIPPDLRQTLHAQCDSSVTRRPTRIPRRSPSRARHRTAARQVDPPAGPEPDPVWYKWSTIRIIISADDPSNWRKGPDDLGERHAAMAPQTQPQTPPAPQQSERLPPFQRPPMALSRLRKDLPHDLLSAAAPIEPARPTSPGSRESSTSPAASTASPAPMPSRPLLHPRRQ